MTGKQRDNIYQTPQQPEPFRFDEKVAAVFPDMIQRSVPGYGQIIEGIQALARQFITSDSHAYDLGCSLGAASLAMSLGNQHQPAKIFAIDNSTAMIERCRLFVDSYHHQTPIDVIHGNLEDQTIEKASMVVLNFTLQFIPKDQRASILRSIYNGMQSGAALILSEKVVTPHVDVNELLIDLHHDFKRANGYSDLEISQKRNALENVLVPESIDDHFARLHDVGFKQMDVWYKHFNFCSMIAIKS